MFTQNPSQRTYRNRSDQRQHSPSNIPNEFNYIRARSNDLSQMQYEYEQSANHNMIRIDHIHPNHRPSSNELLPPPPPPHGHHANHRTLHRLHRTNHNYHTHSSSSSQRHGYHHHPMKHSVEYLPPDPFMPNSPSHSRVSYHRNHSSPPHHMHPTNHHYSHTNSNAFNDSKKYSNHQRKGRNHNHNNYTSNHRHRSGYNGYTKKQSHQPSQPQTTIHYQQFETINYTEHHQPRPCSHPLISSDILVCIDTVGPQLIQYLPASTAYYLIESIEPYLTNHNNDRVPLRRKSELLSKWHNSYPAQRRIAQYLSCEDMSNRLCHFNSVHVINNELASSLCIWEISMKRNQIQQYFGAQCTRELLVRAILCYIIMECFLKNKENVWFPKHTKHISIKKHLNAAEIHKFLVSKLQKIDDTKKFYTISPKIDGNDSLLTLLNEFKARFERDNCGGDTLLYCQSWNAEKFENILNKLTSRYPVDKQRKRAKKSAVYELGCRSRLDRPIFGFYIGKHRGYNPRTKGIELKFNPMINYSYFYDLKWLFLPEFIEDRIANYFCFDVKWESDYTRGEQFKYFNLVCSDIQCDKVEDTTSLYRRFKFVVWKGQYFDSDDNLLGQYSG